MLLIKCLVSISLIIIAVTRLIVDVRGNVKLMEWYPKTPFYTGGVLGVSVFIGTYNYGFMLASIVKPQDLLEQYYLLVEDPDRMTLELNGQTWKFNKISKKYFLKRVKEFTEEYEEYGIHRISDCSKRELRLLNEAYEQNINLYNIGAPKVKPEKQYWLK